MVMIPHPRFHRRMRWGKCPSQHRWRLCRICRLRRGIELYFVFVSVNLLFHLFFVWGKGESRERMGRTDYRLQALNQDSARCAYLCESVFLRIALVFFRR